MEKIVGAAISRPRNNRKKVYMRVIKKNQLVILMVGLMLVIAGYLNYTETQGDIVQTDGKLDVASIGDATLVSSEPLIEGEETNTVDTSAVVPASSIKEEEAVSNNSEYFINSKLQRDTMYSQMIDSYQKMIESSSITAEQKAIAQNEIKKINETKNAIMIAENLIRNKGFKEVIILVNDMNINVIIEKENSKPEDIAQIQNIVAREMKAQIENIHISNR